MNGNVYILKKYIDKQNYSEFTEDLVEQNIEPLQNITFLEHNNSSFRKIKLPNTSLQALDFILNKFELSKFKEEFLSLISLTQNLYLTYLEIYSDELINDFKDEKKELQNFLNIIEEYLNNGKKSIHSISFKFNTENFNPIKNKFLLEDLFKSLLINFDINRDNFLQRKQELLLQSETIKHKKGGEFVKSELVKSLAVFLKSNVSNISEITALRFCDYFLHICQIQSNNNDEEIVLENYEDDFNGIDYQNLKHFLTNRANFYF